MPFIEAGVEKVRSAITTTICLALVAPQWQHRMPPQAKTQRQPAARDRPARRLANASLSPETAAASLAAKWAMASMT